MSNDQILDSGLRILVVDDSDLVLHLVERMLRQSQVILTAAEDGVEAVYKAATRRLDIVLMDLNLPNMDGKTAANEIRKLQPNLPIIALSGEDSAPDTFDGFVQKPVKSEELHKVILSVLRRNQIQS